MAKKLLKNVDEKPSKVSFKSNLRHRPHPLKPWTQIPKADQLYVDGEPIGAPTSKEVQKQPSIARPHSLAVVLQEQFGEKSGDNKGAQNVQSQLNPIPHFQPQAEMNINCATIKQVCRQAATQPTTTTPKRKRSQEPKKIKPKITQKNKKNMNPHPKLNQKEFVAIEGKLTLLTHRGLAISSKKPGNKAAPPPPKNLQPQPPAASTPTQPQNQRRENV